MTASYHFNDPYPTNPTIVSAAKLTKRKRQYPMSNENQQPQQPQKPQQPQQPQQPQKRVTIELPKDLKASYANIAFITHTPAEMILDFAQVLPRTPKGEIVSRLIMSPMHAKSFLKALETNVANFEKQYGEIKIPEKPHPADQLFKDPPPWFGEEGDDDNKQ
ncbi:MAG: hypothetical protein ACI85U_004152 [Candidatus Promineifilaceae bacterium]